MMFKSLAAGLLASAAIASAAPAETFKWAFQGDAQTMDPHGMFETMTMGFQRNIYEGLVIRDADMKMTGALAESWENTEPKVWRFKLRPGVKFHNGNPLTAADVAFSLERMRTEGSDMKVIAALIEKAEVIDDLTIDLHTPTPNPILINQLEIFYIMDREWAEANGAVEATNVKGGDEGNYANLNANGTGPFVLSSRQAGVKTVLSRNPDYWGTVPGNVTEAVFTPIAQDATRVAALLSGDVDMVYPVSVQDWNRLEDSEGVNPLTGPEARTIFLGFDQDRDELLYSDVKGANPFKDVRVRQAFMQAISVDAIKAKVMRGASQPTGHMVAPAINGYSTKIEEVRLPYDAAAAKALLTEAGYPEGFEVTMDCPNDRYVNDEKICQAVASMLAKIGVKVDLLAQPKSKYFGKVLAQNNYDTSFFLLGWSPSTFDSHNPISGLMACRTDGMGAYNLGGYCNPRVTELAQLIQEETDQTKRQQMIDEAFLIHAKEVGHIPLHNQPLSWGISDGVEVVQRPDNVLDLRYVQVGN